MLTQWPEFIIQAYETVDDLDYVIPPGQCLILKSVEARKVDVTPFTLARVGTMVSIRHLKLSGFTEVN